jgi:hypothetical protein
LLEAGTLPMILLIVLLFVVHDIGLVDLLEISVKVSIWFVILLESIRYHGVARFISGVWA